MTVYAIVICSLLMVLPPSVSCPGGVIPSVVRLVRNEIQGKPLGDQSPFPIMHMIVVSEVWICVLLRPNSTSNSHNIHGISGNVSLWYCMHVHVLLLYYFVMSEDIFVIHLDRCIYIPCVWGTILEPIKRTEEVDLSGKTQYCIGSRWVPPSGF